MKLVQHMQEKINPNLKLRVLVTVFDRRNKLCRVTLAQMQRKLNNVIFETIIEVDAKLRESPAFAQPITLYAPKTRGAEQYRALAKELLNHGR
jgi:chromosome partitioning protein